MLAGDLAPQPADAILEEMRSTAQRRDDVDKAVRAARAVRRRELLRVAAGDVLGLVDVADVGAALSRITDATLEATLEAVGREVRRQKGLEEEPTRIAIVAMGRYGGFELSYGSDADVLFVHQPVEGADAAPGVAVRHRRRQRGPRPARAARGRPRPPRRRRPAPRGQAGRARAHPRLLRRLLREVVEGLGGAGPAARRRRRGRPGVREAFTALIDPLRYPRGRTVRGRRHRGPAHQGPRRPRAAPARRRPAPAPEAGPRRPGRHRVDDPAAPDAPRRRGRGAAHPAHPARARGGPRGRPGRATRTPRCSPTAGAWSAGCATPSPWPAARPTTSCRKDTRERAAVARILGYSAGGTDEMVNDYLRTTRLARGVVDRVFW